MKLILPHRLTAELQQFGQQIGQRLPRLSPRLKRSGERLVLQARRSKTWLLSGLGLLLLWVWLWQWLLAVGVGLAVTVGLYLAQQGRLRLPSKLIPGWRKLWSPANRALSLAVLGGLLALGSTYLATLLWVSESPGLAANVILQSYGMLAVLGLLLWQGANLGRPSTPGFSRSDLSDLTDEDPLRRLIAVRQMTEAALSPVPVATGHLAASHLADCFRLMLDRETEPLVCSALLDGLQRLSVRSHHRPSPSPASPMPQLRDSGAVPVQPQAPSEQPPAEFVVQTKPEQESVAPSREVSASREE